MTPKVSTLRLKPRERETEIVGERVIVNVIERGERERARKIPRKSDMKMYHGDCNKSKPYRGRERERDKYR